MEQSQKQQKHEHGVKQQQLVEEEEEEVGLQLRGRKTRYPTTTINNGNNNSNNKEIEEATHFSISSNGSSPSNSHTIQDADHESLHPASVCFDELRGTNGRCSEVNCNNAASSDFKTNPGDVVTLTENFDTQEKLIEEIKHEHGEILEDDSCSDLSSALYSKSVEEKGVEFKSFDNEAVIEENIDLIEEIDEEKTEFDVEKVLAKQSTHDLYCPNCNSCITRRIILRRRKPKVRNARRKPKHHKAETPLHYQFDPGSLSATTDRDCNRLSTGSSSIPAPSNDIPDGEPDVFRCLSCFSIFIPTGNGFKLFRIFGDGNENKNIQNPQETPEVKTNWFSIFATNQKKTKIEQGDAAMSHSEANGTNEYSSSCFSDSVTAEHKIDDIPVVTSHDAQAKPHKHVEESRDLSNMEHLYCEKVLVGIDKSNLTISSATLSKKNDLLPSVSPSNESPHLEGLGNDAKSFDQKTGMGVINSSIEETEYSKSEPIRLENHSNVATENSNGGIAILNQSRNDTTRYEKGKESNTTTRDQQWIESGQVLTMRGPTSASQLLCEEGSTKDMSIEPDKGSKSALLSFFQGMLILQNFKFGVRLGKADAAKEKNKGNDVVISVETEQLEPAPQTSRNALVAAEDRILAQGNFDEQRNSGVGVDILKSIVYGGLIESITSLGVTCSAAGAGAATLDIVAMALANLIGGLFIIGHNLIDLKNDGSRGASSQMNQQEDRYEALLGKREKFSLHVTVVIISYLIFGLLPPVIYGFSFLKSDDKDLKLALVGGASLICILLLAIGKAYVARQPKSYIHCVLYYGILGFMASGASYIVGDLIGKFLREVGWFQSSLSLLIPYSEAKTKLLWTS